MPPQALAAAQREFASQIRRTTKLRLTCRGINAAAAASGGLVGGGFCWGRSPHSSAPWALASTRAQTRYCVRACRLWRLFAHLRPQLRRGPCPCAGPLRGGAPALVALSLAASPVPALGPCAPFPAPRPLAVADCLRARPCFAAGFLFGRPCFVAALALVQRVNPRGAAAGPSGPEAAQGSRPCPLARPLAAPFFFGGRAVFCCAPCACARLASFLRVCCFSAAAAFAFRSPLSFPASFPRWGKEEREASGLGARFSRASVSGAAPLRGAPQRLSPRFTVRKLSTGA